MATAPCPFGRPEGMELVRSVQVVSGPDLKLILASHATSFDVNDRNYYYVPFGSVSQAMNIRGENHQKILILDVSPAGPDRVHILGCTTHRSQIIVENFSCRTGKGNYYEFAPITSHHVGSIYLFDTRRVFPPDDTYRGEVIRVSFTGDILAAQLEGFLAERGYRIHSFKKEVPLIESADKVGRGTIWAIPCRESLNGMQLVYLDDWMDKANYTPVGDIIRAEDTVLAEKIGIPAICCRTREYLNACKRGYECPLIGACEAK